MKPLKYRPTHAPPAKAIPNNVPTTSPPPFFTGLALTFSCVPVSVSAKRAGFVDLVGLVFSTESGSRLLGLPVGLARVSAVIACSSDELAIQSTVTDGALPESSTGTAACVGASAESSGSPPLPRMADSEAVPEPGARVGAFSACAAASQSAASSSGSSNSPELGVRVGRTGVGGISKSPELGRDSCGLRDDGAGGAGPRMSLRSAVPLKDPEPG